jgi:hypothetical protein
VYFVTVEEFGKREWSDSAPDPVSDEWGMTKAR